MLSPATGKQFAPDHGTRLTDINREIKNILADNQQIEDAKKRPIRNYGCKP